jgi:hypothetical protein
MTNERSAAMLPVPALKPDQEPFTPDAAHPVHPLLKSGNHTLPIARAPFASAIPGESAPGSAPSSSHASPLSPREEGNAVLARALDHALVKEAITSLHLEDDLQTEKLRAYTHTQICDIVPDYARFVAAQRDTYANLLKTNTQRHFFQQAASSYFARAAERSHALRNARIRQFQKETIEKQNQEFLARALRPENLMNDSLQTQYRDMILHNLELLLADAPADERQSALDAACRDLYIKVMDKRLAVDPHSLESILGSSAVKRVLSREELSIYRETTRKAISSQLLSKKALAWAQDGVSPKEAKSMAWAQHSDEVERDTLFDFFEQHRYNLNRKRFLQTILDIDSAWRVLKNAGYAPAAIPDWVKNGDPGLFACMTRTIAVHEKNGGLHPTPEYVDFIEFTSSFDPHATAQHLADAQNVYALVDTLGDPDSPAFLAVLRLLLGKSTPADRNWFATLSCAHTEYCAAADGELLRDQSRDRINSFLEMLDKCRSVKLQREKREELDPLEIRTLVRDCLASCGQFDQKEKEEGLFRES